jgi:hypothetical protein
MLHVLQLITIELQRVSFCRGVSVRHEFATWGQVRPVTQRYPVEIIRGA